MSWDGNERRAVDWKEVVSHMATTNEQLKAANRTLTDLTDKIKIQNGRIGKLENWRSFCVGGIAVIMFIINFIK